MIVARGSSVIPRASPAASTRLVSFLSAMSDTALWELRQTLPATYLGRLANYYKGFTYLS